MGGFSYDTTAALSPLPLPCTPKSLCLNPFLASIPTDSGQRVKTLLVPYLVQQQTQRMILANLPMMRVLLAQVAGYQYGCDLDVGLGDGIWIVCLAVQR